MKIEDLKKKLNDDGILELSNEEFYSLDKEVAKRLSDENLIDLVHLPPYEIDFFEWLRKCDKEIWDDLWASDDLLDKPYVISTLFLPMMIEDKERGFPICDLLNKDNYFFTPKHMVDEESKVFIEVAERKFESRTRMTHMELLAFEISLGPIDIWHFSYKYKLDLNDCKNAVHKLVDDNALVHLKEAEHLAPFIEF